MAIQPEIGDFIAKWAKSDGAERANYALFLTELCDQIGVEHPDASGSQRAGDYTFERPVKPRESADITNPKRIDLYKRDAFILEAKQSRLPGEKNALPGQTSLFNETPQGERTAQRGRDVMMRNARKQAEGYVFLLDAEHKAPPFVIVCDVGHCFELYADFTGTGRAYTQFPDRNGYRVFLNDLRDPKARDLLKAIWTDPHSLDPAKKAVRVTRIIASYLAEVSKALEERGNNAEDVAHFLMRCLFTMFAEDTGLLPKESFRDLLRKCVERPETFTLRLKQLWSEMEKGVEFSHVIDARVRHFNGGLFKNTTAFELKREEIGVLLRAAEADWREVDPAIFGTLLEQALDPAERQRLGAHYTPRAYVQRLVEVTVMEPLRADWEAALTKAELAKDEGKDADAIAIVRGFHDQLTHTRVLDPACGTGNFLYVALELMKQLEGEVLETLTKLGDEQGLLTLKNLTVDPHLFLGLELNPRAAAIAELVVWIGYLQWHYRNTSEHPQEPILRAFENINFGKREGYDAVLTWEGFPVPRVAHNNMDRRRPRRPAAEEDGASAAAPRAPTFDNSRQDAGEGAGGPYLHYPNPRRPAWPEAEFIVGNPPFIGNKRMNTQLGVEYVSALRTAWPEVSESSDLVMYWWVAAATKAARLEVRRFGLVTTNSITMTFNRSMVEAALDAKSPISLVYAIPDHPWSEGGDAAAVRVAMTVGTSGDVNGTVQTVRNIKPGFPDSDRLGEPQIGKITGYLRTGVRLDDAQPLRAKVDLSYMGVIPVSLRFVLSLEERQFLGISESALPSTVKPYLGGKDLADNRPNRFIVDFFGLTEFEARNSFPKLYQHVFEHVKPFRDTVTRKNHRENWWIFGEPRPGMRMALEHLPDYIATTETSKHRWFTALSSRVLPDQKIRIVASSDRFLLAVMSSRFRVVWATTVGGRVGKGNDPVYNGTICFDPFPFPDPPEPLKARLRALGEELDATRKRVQAEHPDLTLTGLYNVLEKLKAGGELTPAEEDVKTRGLVLVLKDLHDQIDAATAQAYGWPADLSDEQILERLVTLNAERAREEAQGFVRWLRPDYQIPRFAKQAPAPKTGELDLEETPAAGAPTLPDFPKDRYEQPLALEAALAAYAQPVDAAGAARLFKGKATEARQKRVAEVLTTLAKYGRVIALEGKRYAARRAA